ncbi:MAG: glycosyltransferase family 2 protein [Christensenellales bacterium]|jgi:glycosyltransferase involved in cell wall biosynthesis
MAFFSICIPMYNAEKTIVRCIDSVLNQSYKDFEVIIVNDGSTDNSVNIADEVIKEDSRFRIIAKNNQGVFHARTTGYELATGEFIISLDSDDYLEPTALEEIYDCVSNIGADMVIFGNYEVLENGLKSIAPMHYPNRYIWNVLTKEELWRDFFFTNRLTTVWRKTFRRDLLQLDSIREYPRISMSDDWIHSFWPFRRAQLIVYLARPLINYCIFSTSMTRVFDPTLFATAGLVRNLQMELIRSKEVVGITEEEVDISYLTTVVKHMVYSPGKPKSKQDYMMSVKSLRENGELVDMLTQYKTKLGKLLAYPSTLFLKRRYEMLYLVKSISVRLRSLLNR